MTRVIYEFLVSILSDGQMYLRLIDIYDDEYGLVQIGEINGHPIFVYEKYIRLLSYDKFTDFKYKCRVEDKMLVELKNNVIVGSFCGDDKTKLNFGNLLVFSY